MRNTPTPPELGPQVEATTLLPREPWKFTLQCVASVFGFGIAIILLVYILNNLEHDSTWIGFGAFMSALFGISTLATVFSSPRRLEITDTSLRLYGLTWFRIVERSDLVRVRLLASKASPTYELTFNKGKKIVLEDSFSEPGKLGRLLTAWTSAVIKSTFDLRTPHQLFKFTKEDVRTQFLTAAVLIGYGVFVSFDTQRPFLFVTTILPYLFIAGVRQLFKPHQIILATGIEVKKLRSTKVIPFEQVAIIQIQPTTNGHEKIYLRSADQNVVSAQRALWEYESDQLDYPQIRDFIIQACPQAQVTGPAIPASRILNSLPESPRPQLPEPPSQPLPQQQEQPTGQADQG